MWAVKVGKEWKWPVIKKKLRPRVSTHHVYRCYDKYQNAQLVFWHIKAGQDVHKLELIMFIHDNDIVIASF